MNKNDANYIVEENILQWLHVHVHPYPTHSIYTENLKSDQLSVKVKFNYTPLCPVLLLFAVHP